MRKLAFAIACVVSLAFVADAGDWYVDQAKGNAGNDGKTPKTAKQSFSETWQGLAKAGDTVWIIGEVLIDKTIDLYKDDIVIAGYGDTASINAQGKCRIMNLNAASVVSNLTLKGGIDKTADAINWSYYAAGVEVAKGKLTHCKVTGCRPGDNSHHCSAVRITGGGVVDQCEICDNDAGKLNTSYAAGVDLKSANAKLLNSRIHNCRGRAVAVYVESGLVEGCDIYNNTNYPAAELSGATAGSGAGIRADGNNDGSKVSRCRIYGNYGYGNGGGLWLRDGAALENCLVYGNHAEKIGGAIYCNSGNSNVRFCNIGGNTSDGGEGAAIYVNGGSPAFKNNIIYGNGADVSKEIKLESTSAPFTYNLLSAAMSGEGNIVAKKPPYVDAANGNYMTANDSEGIDCAQDIVTVTLDILGTARPLDGGTGKAVSDIGCVEYVDQTVLYASVVYMNPAGSDERPYDTAEKGAHDLATALSAVDPMVLGHGEVRICDGTYDIGDVEALTAQPVWILGGGAEKVTLVGTSLTLNNAGARVSGVTFSGRSVGKPYCVDLIQGTVSNCVLRDFRYEIAKDETFVGGALILAGSDVAPKVCRTVDSVISNCVVTLAPGRELKSWDFPLVGAGVAFRSAGGSVLERCLVSDCSVAGSGGGIFVGSNGGRIVDCEVTRCKASITDDSDGDNKAVQGGGLYLYGTVGNTIYVSGCNIHHNFANGCGGGLFVKTGASKRIWNCRITDNEVYAYAGSGLRIEQEDSAVTVVNCLIARNNKRKSTGGAPGIYLKGGRMVNCTVTDNTGGASGAGATVYAWTSEDVHTQWDGNLSTNYLSWVRNTIIWGNRPTNWDGVSPKDISAGARNEYSNLVVPAADGVEGTNIINRDPKLSASYALRAGSSAIDAGNNDFYNIENYGVLDLAGNPRFHKDGTIDIGCFESACRPGLMLIFR